MKCFEINLLLQDHQAKEFKDIRQYFHQERGSHQAIQDTLAWVHLTVKNIKKEKPNFVIERLIIWAWEIAIPLPTGEIKTKKFNNRVLNWSYEKGIIDMTNFLTPKQRKKVQAAARFLNKYRHVRAEVEIEEIGRELVTEDVTCIVI